MRAHPHLVVAGAVGLAVGAFAPDIHTATGRCLLGWNVCVWFYLAWTGWTMSHSDKAHLKRVAEAQAEGASVVLAIVALSALASLGAILMELSAAKAAGPQHALPHVLATVVTVTGSWLILPTLFSLNYASLYHITEDGNDGLQFPEEGKDFEPDYVDFLYFSFTIAVANQTSDVAVTSRTMRRLVLLHSILSFLFNTLIIAFTINIGASML